MGHQKNVVLVTSGQPSLNPRLVKEADTLSVAGYNVTVIYQYWNDWGTAMDIDLIAGKRWKAVRVGGSPSTEFFQYFLSRAIHKTGQLLHSFCGNKFGLSEISIGRCTALLVSESLKHHAELYIAHNLAALPAVVKAAKKTGVKCAFDAEDYHRKEVTDDDNDNDVVLKKFIEDKYIPQVNYISASSEGIGAAYKRLYQNIDPVTILNVFPADHNILTPERRPNTSLKLFWFSQTIGPKRGLEDVFRALDILNNSEIEIHLLGNLDPAATAYLKDINPRLLTHYLHPTTSNAKINQFAAGCDIGLALEPGFCQNNDMALSNKIFTYMQSGLAIIASDTSAQRALLNNYPDVGKLYHKGNAEMLAAIIDNYYQNRETLYNARLASYHTARSNLNWEIESLKFLEVVERTLI